uniref:Uncharacterized protein n=1 Tax=Rhizophora mucronata TaxID=61149 RepID=A0A2P2NNQ7_RHIMU
MSILQHFHPKEINHLRCFLLTWQGNVISNTCSDGNCIDISTRTFCKYH